MVVSPPKAGKTTILKQIAGGIWRPTRKAHVMILLVDEPARGGHRLAAHRARVGGRLLHVRQAG